MALSGGMDSSALLLHLLREGYTVTAISFNYGQKHIIELERAASLIEYLREYNLNVIHHTADLTSATALFSSHLLQQGADVPKGHYEESNMKATVVPNRNAMLHRSFTEQPSQLPPLMRQVLRCLRRSQRRPCHLSRLSARILPSIGTRLCVGKLGQRACLVYAPLPRRR